MKIKAYHGTNAIFKQFEQSKSRVPNDFYGGGVMYATNNLEIAKKYANAAVSQKGGNKIIYEVELNLNNIFDVDHKFTGKELTNFISNPEEFARSAGLLKLGVGDDKYLILSKLKTGDMELTGDQIFKGLSKGQIVSNKARDILIKLEYDGLRYNGGMNMKQQTIHDVYLVYNAKDITIQKTYRLKKSSTIREFKEKHKHLLPLEESVIVPIDSLKIPRDQMPQIKSEDLQNFIQWLDFHGAKITKEVVKVNTLKASQGELNIGKIKDIVRKPEQLNKPVVVSKDNYVLDGHHRWAGKYHISQQSPVNIFRVWYNIKELLAITSKYPRVFYKEI